MVTSVFRLILAVLPKMLTFLYNRDLAETRDRGFTKSISSCVI